MIIVLGLIMPQVSNAGHIGGFIAGWVIGKLLPLQPKSQTMFDLLGGLAGLAVVISFGLVALG